MSHTIAFTPAPIETVFALLADPARYEEFVVGNSTIRSFDPDWPSEGATFHHSLGIKPFVVKDKSISLATDHATYLVMETRMSVLGASITAFELSPTGAGTKIEIFEEAISGPFAWLWSRPVDALLDWRNRRLLERLCRLAEKEAGIGADTPPAAAAHDR
ncbi:MAG: SRPBCC family protein [Actinomycetes bacterium]|jgi:hypothetical protein|nr:SRPBCC family protein [Acidimicrobiia bacterium]